MVVTMDADRLRLPDLDRDLPLPSDRAARRALVGTVLDRLQYADDAGQQPVIEDVELECRCSRMQGHVDCRPMTWAQLCEMHASGMEICGPGAHYRLLAKLPDGDRCSQPPNSSHYCPSR